LVWYNFDILRERVLTFFGTNVTDKVSNQKALYYATSNNVCFCTTWQNGETRKLHFSLKFCISALSEFIQSLLYFFSLFDSRLILTLLYDSLNLVVNALSSGCWETWFRRKEVKSAAAVGLSYMHNAYAPMRCLPERKKNVMCDVFDSV